MLLQPLPALHLLQTKSLETDKKTREFYLLTAGVSGCTAQQKTGLSLSGHFQSGVQVPANMRRTDAGPCHFHDGAGVLCKVSTT